jgi:hypothetical protein
MEILLLLFLKIFLKVKSIGEKVKSDKHDKN